MTNVLVTGATTPLGAALIEKLVADERTKSVLAVGAERASEVTLPSDKRITYQRVDLTRVRTRSRRAHKRLIGSGLLPAEGLPTEYIQ